MKDIDVVIYGASGYSGRLVAAFLAKVIRERASGSGGRGRRLRWAVSGRSVAPLEALVASFRADGDDETAALPFILVSTTADISAIASRARVLINCAGPFSLCGSPVLAACVRNSCHYVDICGEPAFLSDAHREMDKPAKNADVTAIVCAGFDCVPAEIAASAALVRLTAGNSQRVGSGIEVDAYLSTKSGLSMGTIRTLLTSLAAGAGQRAPRRSKTGAPARRGAGREAWLPKRKPHFGWIVPLPSADPHVLRLTARLLHNGGTTDASALNVVDVNGVRYWLLAGSFARWLVLIAAAVVTFAVAKVSFLRGIVLRRLPAGRGPPEEELRSGSHGCELTCVARWELGNEDVAAGWDTARATATATVRTSHIYRCTAACVVHAALFLLGHEDGKGMLPRGVLTPRAALATCWEEYVSALYPYVVLLPASFAKL